MCFGTNCVYTTVITIVNVILRAGLDLESGLKNGLGWKKSTPLIGREVGTRLFKFTP